jgi:hypothetical protein
VTETELVLATLTREELIDAMAWADMLNEAWRTMSVDERRAGQFETDGPWHLIRAMQLAALREAGARYGADAWYIGMPTVGHVAGKLLELYQSRLAVNPDRSLAPRPSASGAMVQECVMCGESKPLTLALWERSGGLWRSMCRDCMRVAPGAALDVLEPETAA